MTSLKYLLPGFFLLFLCSPVYATSNDFETISYMDDHECSILLPESFDPARSYATVYFMPQDGYSAEQYFLDGIESRLRKLESEGCIPPMIYVFPELRDGVSPEEQIRSAVEAVETAYPALSDASMRGVIGTDVGGSLAFLAGYSAWDGSADEHPALFSAIASHDGDFSLDRNPYAKPGDMSLSPYLILRDAVDGNGADVQWTSNYYTYLDCDADKDSTWAEGGSADIASYFRSKGLSGTDIPLAWDYSVFEYSIRSSAKYGSYLDNLERSLSGFAHAFHLDYAGEKPQKEAEVQIQETILTGDERRIDLMGDWYFRTVESIKSDLEKDDSEKNASGKNNLSRDLNRVESILEADWKNWDVVTPGLDWWTEDFASCLNGNPYYIGYAWYVREFEVPEGFDTTDLQIRAGMLDEADEVFLNGTRIGQTGIPQEGGAYDGSNPWDEERCYPVPEDLLRTGINTIAVRICNSSGGGGWYAGPIRIEYAKKKDPSEEEKPHYYTTSFSSTSLNGQEIEYRVYLPEDYYEKEKRYPVVYMLHGYGSTGKSFEIAGVPQLLDEAIASGEIPPCIVIFPSDGHFQKVSWWTGAYAKMLTEDLVTEVDNTLRTLDDRNSRFLAGESMGGGGAYLNALNHPEKYGGILDIYGALRYTHTLKTFLDMDAEDLEQYRHYFICGTHDMYCFDLDHILMAKHLHELKVPHIVEIDNGEHSSSFYLPRLIEGLAYLLA